MKVIAIFIVLFFVSACGQVQNIDMVEADELCKNNEGVAYMQLDWFANTVVCNNNAQFRVSK